jgi:acyl carrier protein
MEIRTSFTTLRQTADRIIQVVSDMRGIDKKEISINSSINNDLGIDGDDWMDLQEALQNKEGVSLEGLKFYDYFWDEGQIAGSGDFIISTIMFFRYIISFKWLKMRFSEYYAPPGQSTDVLTIGDLITSKYEGRFVKRSERTFVLQ